MHLLRLRCAKVTPLGHREAKWTRGKVDDVSPGFWRVDSGGLHPLSQIFSGAYVIILYS